MGSSDCLLHHQFRYESCSLLRCCCCCLQRGVLARRTLYSCEKSCRASENQILHWPPSTSPTRSSTPAPGAATQEQQQGNQQQDLWWPDSSKWCLGISGWFCRRSPC